MGAGQGHLFPCVFVNRPHIKQPEKKSKKMRANRQA
jgi:hypothetical protein